MADSVTTVLISAGVGGIAGSVFPAVKDAIKFVVLEADSQIDKMNAEQKANVEAFQSRQSFKNEVTTHTQEVFSLIHKGQEMFASYRDGGAFDSAGVAGLTVDLQRSRAYLEPFDVKATLSPEAAAHISRSISFAEQMLDVLRQMRKNEYSDKGLLTRDDGDGPVHIALMGKLLELQAGAVSSLQLWAIAEQDENARATQQIAETDRLIRDLRRKRSLSAIFLVAVAVAAVVIAAVLVHVQTVSARKTH